ncbi:hypothetical protein [Marinobacter sp. MBR-105]|jgi:hypothetical protein
MLYHAPTRRFTVAQNDIERTTICLLLALKHIREISGLPLTAYSRDGVALDDSDHAQKNVIDAAKAIGIDLGAEWGNELDLSDNGQLMKRV